MTKDELNEKIIDWNVEDGIIILEPQEEFNDGIIGISEDKCHLIYSYQKLTESLAKKYESDFYEKNPDNIYQPELKEDFIQDACEWLDYNTVRQLPYMNEKYRPVIIYEY